MTARMIVPKLRNLENKLPARIKPYFQQGTRRNYVQKENIVMSITDALDVYKMMFKSH